MGLYFFLPSPQPLNYPPFLIDDFDLVKVLLDNVTLSLQARFRVSKAGA